VSLCPYCEFVVFTGSAARGPRSRVAGFLAAVEVELGLRADELDLRFGPPGGADHPSLATLYFGGGTPSLLPADGITTLVELIDRRFGLASDVEITLEANPGPLDRGDAAAFVRAGITRISFGAQSFQETELRTLGRRHRPGDVVEAVADAMVAGIKSINLDLLYDVPGQTVDSWAHSLEEALALAPDHLSLYGLALGDPDHEGLTGPLGDHLPTRRGAARWRARARGHQDEDRAAAMYEYATERLAASGWRGYEISNWAKPGHECRHNLAYWRREPVAGVGPGAHFFDGVTRRWNGAPIGPYLEALTPPPGRPASLPRGGEEQVDPETAEAERIMLALRMDSGLAADALRRLPLSRAAAWARDLELLSVAEGRVSLTTRGRLLSNSLFEQLL
jgi:putative oxygen-independent coproporphyrinogen III oxidase